MKTLLVFFEKRSRALLCAILYVGFGTLAVCSVYPKDLFYGEWTLYALFVTFPVSIISFGYRYAESNNLVPVFVIQFFMFVVTFLLFSTFIKNKTKNS